MTDYEDQMERQDQVWLDEVRDKQHLDRMWMRIKGEAVDDAPTVIKAEE